MTNKYKAKRTIVGDIESSIELLCMEYGRATFTEILTLARINSTDESRALIEHIANSLEYRVVSVRGGRVVIDTIWDFKSGKSANKSN